MAAGKQAKGKVEDNDKSQQESTDQAKTGLRTSGRVSRPSARKAYMTKPRNDEEPVATTNNGVSKVAKAKGTSKEGSNAANVVVSSNVSQEDAETAKNLTSKAKAVVPKQSVGQTKRRSTDGGQKEVTEGVDRAPAAGGPSVEKGVTSSSIQPVAGAVNHKKSIPATAKSARKKEVSLDDHDLPEEVKSELARLRADVRKLHKEKNIYQMKIRQSASHNETKSQQKNKPTPIHRNGLHTTNGTAVVTSSTREPLSDDESITKPKYLGTKNGPNVKAAILEGMTIEQYTGIRVSAFLSPDLESSSPVANIDVMETFITKTCPKADFDHSVPFTQQKNNIADSIADAARAKFPILWRYRRNWAAVALCQQNFKNVKSYTRERGDDGMWDADLDSPPMQKKMCNQKKKSPSPSSSEERSDESSRQTDSGEERGKKSSRRQGKSDKVVEGAGHHNSEDEIANPDAPTEEQYAFGARMMDWVWGGRQGPPPNPNDSEEGENLNSVNKTSAVKQKGLKRPASPAEDGNNTNYSKKKRTVKKQGSRSEGNAAKALAELRANFEKARAELEAQVEGEAEGADEDEGGAPNNEDEEGESNGSGSEMVVEAVDDM